jgi:tetratricopeptide (TPR) repeat protein
MFIKKGIVLLVVSFLTTVGVAQSLEVAIKNKENERFEKSSSEFSSLIAEAAKQLAANPIMNETLSELYFEKGENYLMWAELESDNSSLFNEKLDSAKIMFLKGVTSYENLPLNHIGLGIYQAIRGNKVGMAEELNLAHAQIENRKLKLTKEVITKSLLEEAGAWVHYGQKSDLPKALTILNGLKEKNDKLPELYVVWGDYEYAMSNYDLTKSLAMYDKARELQPTNPRITMFIGKIYKRVKNFSKAQDFFDRSIAMAPEFSPAYREKAELLYAQKMFTEAAETYLEYLNLNNSCSVRQRYSTFLFLTQEYSKAKTALEGSISCNPDNLVVYRILGYNCLETGDFQEGLDNLNYFIDRAEPKGYVIGSDYAKKGMLLIKLGQDSLGVLEIEKAIKVDTSFHDGYTILSDHFKQKKDYKNAVKWISAKIEMGLGSNLDRYSLGQAYYFSKQFSKADSVFAQLEELYIDATLFRAKSQNRLDPNESFQGLAKPFYESYIKKIGGSIEAIERNKKGLIEAYDYLGVYYLKKENDACSKAAFERVLSIDPAHKRATEMLATKELSTLDPAIICTDLVQVTNEEIAPSIDSGQH